MKRLRKGIVVIPIIAQCADHLRGGAVQPQQ